MIDDDIYDPETDPRGEGGGGEGGEPADDNDEVTFSDDEAEIFEATEVTFDDQTEVEVFIADEIREEIQARKHECGDIAVSVSDDAVVLGVIALGLGLIG